MGAKATQDEQVGSNRSRVVAPSLRKLRLVPLNHKSPMFGEVGSMPADDVTLSDAFDVVAPATWRKAVGLFVPIPILPSLRTNNNEVSELFVILSAEAVLSAVEPFITILEPIVAVPRPTLPALSIRIASNAGFTSPGVR